MPGPVIPESLHDELFTLYGEIDPATSRRRTYRDLSRWLLSTHNVVASHEAVRRIVGPLRIERAELRREVLRERLLAQIAPQVDTLDELMVKAQALTNVGPKGKKPSASVVLDTLDAYRKGVETKLKFAGIGERVEAAGEVDAEGNAATMMTFYVPKKVDE